MTTIMIGGKTYPIATPRNPQEGAYAILGDIADHVYPIAAALIAEETDQPLTSASQFLDGQYGVRFAYEIVKQWRLLRGLHNADIALHTIIWEEVMYWANSRTTEPDEDSGFETGSPLLFALVSQFTDHPEDGKKAA
ncbi:MAG: hypothetical protein AAF442_09270 [Pseudomonadota bacterium]